MLGGSLSCNSHTPAHCSASSSFCRARKCKPLQSHQNLKTRMHSLCNMPSCDNRDAASVTLLTKHNLNMNTQRHTNHFTFMFYPITTNYKKKGGKKRDHLLSILPYVLYGSFWTSKDEKVEEHSWTEDHSASAPQQEMCIMPNV